VCVAAGAVTGRSREQIVHSVTNEITAAFIGHDRRQSLSGTGRQASETASDRIEGTTVRFSTCTSCYGKASVRVKNFVKQFVFLIRSKHVFPPKYQRTSDDDE
jgi:hypothetical protein